MPEPTPSSPLSQLAEIRDLDRKHLIHPITELRKQEKVGPKVFVGGKGVELFLGDGRTVIDGFSGLFNISVGHGRSEIADAVAEQMRKLAYYPSFWDFGNEPAARLAEKLMQLLPEDRGLQHVLFNTGGSDSNEANFKIAKLYHAVRGNPSKTRILSRRWSYHGATRGAGSATGIEAYHALMDRDPEHEHVSLPYCYRCEFNKTHPGCGLPCAEDLERTIERVGADQVAAFVVEPVMGTGGIIVPPPDYFDAVQEICARNDVLLILDEVITGFGRTGRWFGMEHWNIHPDLVSLAKGISSGYLPLGASVLSDRVYETLRDQMPKGLPFMFGLTYNNHPACCAAGLANVEILEREGLVERARDVGAYLLERLQETFGDSPLAGEIRGLGMLAAIEVVRDREAKTPFPNLGDSARIASLAFEEGLIVRGMFQCVGLAPPLCATRDDVDQIVTRLEQAWRKAEAEIAAG